MKWEYNSLTWTFSRATLEESPGRLMPADMIARADKLGANGWELVCSVANEVATGSSGVGETKLIFKRPLE